MRNKFLWKMMLSFGLLVSLSLSTVGLASTRANSLYTAVGPVKDEVLNNYSQLAARYLKDCDDWDANSRASREELKRCLTIAKELRDKFDLFVQRVGSIADKVKSAKKWTKELDDKFEKNAARRGVDSKLINAVRQNGGFRQYYGNSLNELRSSKADFHAEIQALETAIQEKPASSQIPSLQKISYVSTATTTSPLGARLANVVRMVRFVADMALELAEDLAHQV
jgi:peptidoglycan hydrolase CwlO-like protein